MKILFKNEQNTNDFENVIEDFAGLDYAIGEISDVELSDEPAPIQAELIRVLAALKAVELAHEKAGLIPKEFDNMDEFLDEDIVKGVIATGFEDIIEA